MPAFLLLMSTRWFVDPDLASWDVVDGHLHWIGQWDGLSSLYYHPSLGLAWLALLMTVAVWVLRPERRKLILWFGLVSASIFAGLSLVFASFVGSTGLERLLGYYTQDIAAPRYLFPILVSWAIFALTQLYADPPGTPPEEPGLRGKGEIPPPPRDSSTGP